MTKTDPDAGSRLAVRHLGGQTAIVMSGTAFTFIIGLPFQIYLARAIGADGLGIVGIAEALILTASGLLGFGLAPLAVRFIPEYRLKGATRAIRSLVLVCVVLLAGFGAIGALVLGKSARLLPPFFGITEEIVGILDILSLLLPLSMISYFFAQALRGFQEIWVVIFSTSILALSMKVSLTLVLFYTEGASPRSYAWAMVVAQAIALIPMAFTLKRLLTSLPDEVEPAAFSWRGLASFAGTNYASGVFNTLVGNLDRVVIGGFLGPSAVGVLMVVRQLQQFPNVFHQTVLTVISPVFAKLKAAEDISNLAHQLHLANDWIMRMAASVILVLAILANHVLGLYGAEFADQGSSLLVLVMASVALNLAGGPVGILLNMTGSHAVLFYTTMLTTLLTLASYFLFIPMFGLDGVGLAMLIGMAANKSLSIWLVRKRLGIAWYDPRFRGWILPSVAAGGTLFALRPILEDLSGLGIQAAVLAVCAGVACLIFVGVNLLVGLHEDDQELVTAFRSRVASVCKRGTRQ